MVYKIWISLEHQAENKDHSEFDMPKLLGVFDTQVRAEKFLKLIVGFCDSFGSGIVMTATPPNPQHGRDVKPKEPKPLAQYLAKEIAYHIYGHDVSRWGTIKWQELLEQALDAYQSTENVTIKIERV